MPMTLPSQPDRGPPEHEELHLKKALGPFTLWGLGVGYVISGEYFGWNLGLVEGGSFGLLVAFGLVTVMYVTFVFSYTEMACAIPRAGGVFVYSARSLGMMGGFLGGFAQVIEFVFAPPAIAMAIGGYVQLWVAADWRDAMQAATGGTDPAIIIALVAYVLFTGLNMWGVKQAAVFELIVTVLAVGGLLMFTGVTAPYFQWRQFAADGWPHGWTGVLASLPFAIWFYLAIEGVANVAEEAKNPRRDVARGFGAAIATLVVLAGCVLLFSVGVGGWQRVVYEPHALAGTSDTSVWDAAGQTSDSPLPLAVAQTVGRSHAIYHLIVGIGLLGLIASFNGIILASGRALFEMGRVGFLPHFIGYSHRITRTPIYALLLNFLIGAVAICFLDTGGLITMSAFGAVTLYIVSMIALMRLRVKEPRLHRPFHTPCYPVFPLVALTLSFVSLVTMSWLNLNTGGVRDLAVSYSLWYYGFLLAGFVYYFSVVRGRLTAEDIAHFSRIE